VGNWIGNTRITLFLMYGMVAHPLIECGFHLPYAVMGAPHRDYSAWGLLFVSLDWSWTSICSTW